LITMRLSIINFAGTVRTLVAVGTWRLWSMFAARALAIPFRGATVSVASATSAVSITGIDVVARVGASAGMGWTLGAIEVVLATGAVIGAWSSENAGAGVVTGVGTGLTDTPDSAALDSKSGHQVSSTRWGSF
jgi:hypothetical protein